MSDQDVEFFDSNILIAASIPLHIHHSQSNARIAGLQTGRGACGIHSLAEVYNNLTNRGNRGYGVPTSDAARIVEQFSNTFVVVTLTTGESRKTINDAALHRISGAMIYDALLLACARKVGAKVIYTYNVKHFQAIAPDLESRIREP